MVLGYGSSRLLTESMNVDEELSCERDGRVIDEGEISKKSEALRVLCRR